MRNQKFSSASGQRVRSQKGPGEAASQAAATITSQVQGVLDQQLVKGARVVTNIARSARRAADELETDTPQVAGLMRGMADRIEGYSRALEDQSVTDLYESAADFTRRQPAVVFGIAALAGFLALRTLKSTSTRQELSIGKGRADNTAAEAFHGS
jgi:hypothetical protein